MRTAVSLGVLLAVWLGLQQRAAACSCVLPVIEDSYTFSDHVLRARAIGSFGPLRGQRYYLAQITADPYKGCLRAQRLVLIRTDADSAACGITMRPNIEYLLFAEQVGRSLGLPVLTTGLCNGNSAWSDVSAGELAFLNSREVCCGKSCECHGGDERCAIAFSVCSQRTPAAER